MMNLSRVEYPKGDFEETGRRSDKNVVPIANDDEAEAGGLHLLSNEREWRREQIKGSCEKIRRQNS